MTDSTPPPPGGPYPPPASAAPPAPPGWGPPPAWAPPPAGPAQPAPWGAAHRPGAIPLRPLGLGDLYDGAFRIIRVNPRATLGSAVLVAAVAMAVPVVVTAVLTWTASLGVDSTDLSDDPIMSTVGPLGSLAVGNVLQGLGMTLVTGMVAHVAMAAALGRRLSLGEAWAATHGRRWRLVGLTLLLGLMMAAVIVVYALTWVMLAVSDVGLGGAAAYGLVTVPAFLCLLAWLWVRVYYLPVPALMLERLDVVESMKRGFALTQRQFWRTFGIALLTVVVTGVASQALVLPLSFAGQAVVALIGPDYEVLALVVVQAVTSVVAAAFVTPFTAAVTALQYLDLRMRKEGYDVELLAQAGVARP